MTYLFPLLTIWWGGLFPSGLILYWVVYTAYLIVQQFRIMGWGNLFPLFGWQPSFVPLADASIGTAPMRREALATGTPGKGSGPTSNQRPAGTPGTNRPGSNRPTKKKRRGRKR